MLSQVKSFPSSFSGRTGPFLIQTSEPARESPRQGLPHMEIEVPFAIQQILCLFRGQGCLAMNGTCYGTALYWELRLGIHPLRCRAVKMRCNDRTSQPTELNVIGEHIGFSI